MALLMLALQILALLRAKLPAPTRRAPRRAKRNRTHSTVGATVRSPHGTSGRTSSERSRVLPLRKHAPGRTTKSTN